MNVILIVSDTLRRDYLGCYGNKWVRTPNIDAFADGSMIFDRYYAASFPTIPNRHDIYAGRYTFTYSEWSPLPKDEVILPQLLRQDGYVTMLITDTTNMLRDGFNFDRGFDAWWWIRGQELDRYMTVPKEVKIPCSHRKLHWEWALKQHLRNTSMRQHESDCFVAQTMSAAAKWLELNYDQHENFFLYVDTFDPHEPWDPPKYYVDMYDPDYKGEEVIFPVYGRVDDFLTPEELNHCKALYAGEVTMVDRWFGMLLQKIKDLGLLENTAIIFTTDHGYLLGEHGLIGKDLITPEATGSIPLYEEIARIPLIIRLPNFKGGERCQAIIQPPDITATILELASSKVPKGMDGKSILPLLRGESQHHREMAFTAPPIIEGPVSGQRITVTSNEWSLIYCGQVEKMLKESAQARIQIRRIENATNKVKNELYHLPTDPKQTRDLYDEKRDVAEQLHSNLLKFLESLGTREEVMRFWRKLD